ncbi:MAG: F0F1 ATP synthase subunit delta [Candidatus Saccharimonadales bacterium]
MANKISRQKIAAAVADQIDLAKSEKELSQEIAAYLLSVRRTSELDSLLRDVMQLRADKGIVEVVAASAFPLSATARADIETNIRTHFPATRTVIVSQAHDPNVVGGVRLELANQQLDLSVRAKLNRFKQLTTTKTGV